MELILEGLNCANCSRKIEEKVNQLSLVERANLNFINKTLSIEVKDSNEIEKVIKGIKSIVNQYEPNVVVKEKIIDSVSKKALILMGIICSSCSAKIEEQVRRIQGVKNAYVNFPQGKLVIEGDKNKIDSIVKEAKEIVKMIEPNANAVEEDEDLEPKTESKRKKMLSFEQSKNKWEFIRLVIGIILFATQLVFQFSHPIGFYVYLISYILIGGEILLYAGRNILRGQVFDENFLMSLATIGAFIIGEYPEAIAVMLFYQIGEFMQDLAVNRSRKSITELMNIRADYANIKKDNKVVKVSPEQVEVGDIIVVKPGEKIPLDGVVIEGNSMLDTSALTGESVPREVGVGEEIVSGTVNKNGLLNIRVTKGFSESTVSRILDLVQNASSKKAPTEKFITKFAKYYTPVVVLLAVCIGLIPPLLIPGASFEEWLYKSLIFLVISCPCALVVSIPLGFFGGIGLASKKGILVKGGNYLEGLSNVDTVVFDKTGTLTEGVFKVTKIQTVGSITEEELLEYAAYAESFSNHPIAFSILEYYGSEVNNNIIESYDEISGHGIITKVRGKLITIGNEKLMAKENIKYQDIDTIGTIIHVAIDREYAGYIVISDKIKKDSKRALERLKDIGVRKTAMLTGDNRLIADKIGREVGVDIVYAQLLPHEKVEKIEELEREKASKGNLVYLGDGINDAPVLARSDIGVAMGGVGSDAAIEAADIVLMTDEPIKIVTAIKTAKTTKKIVWQNIIISLGVKVIVLLLGVVGIATMWEAVFADVGVTLIAVFNSMRLLRY